MKPILPMCARLALVLAVPAWLLAVPAAAQHQPHEPAQPAPHAAPAPAQAVPRDNNDSGGSTATRGRTGADDTSSAKPAGRSGGSSAGSGTSSGGDTTSARGRDGKPAIGEAVPRTTPPPATGGGTTVIPAYGGYGYGGYGYGGYYGGYYDPYDPERSYPDPAQYRRYEEGQLRLKVKPRDATVYVDGYYTGIVDDFDGLFQRVRIEAGPHRIEVRAPGLESLEFNVFIEPARTLTLRGELKKIQ